jgi:hypothetical protein
MTTRRRRLSLALGGGALVLACVLAAATAIPVAGQDPSPAPTPSAKPGNGPPSQKPGSGPRTDKARQPKVAELAVTLTGKVGTRTDTDGATVYTLTVGATVYDLHVGPPWWWGENHPLKGLVGKTVTITGERAEGSAAVDVFTVDGKTLREPGKPPWAGGWKVVGPKHPGWAQWKADKAAARDAWKAQGRGGPPPWAGPKASPEPGD